MPGWLPAGSIPPNRMTRDQFWQIIEATAAPTQEEQLERFKFELQQLSVPELTAFGRLFGELHYASYNWDLWTVAWLLQGGMCSDDGFEYFRRWLISRGRAVYETAVREPDALVEEITQTDDPGFETFAYVLSKCYGERVTEEWPEDRIPRPKEPSGGEWIRPETRDLSGTGSLNLSTVFRRMGDVEFAEIERRFPRVWKYCVDKGIIKLRDPNAPPEDPAAREPTPEEVARASVDPNLMQTDLNAYLKQFAAALTAEYKRRREKQ